MLVFGRRFVFSEVLNWVVVAAITVTTLYSGIEYFAKNADVFKEVK